MILFALGIIIGLLLAIIWLLIAFRIPVEPQKLAETICKTFEPKKTGAVIHPPPDDLYAFQSKIKQDDQDNKDTLLDDL